eukprot:XP_019924807.1 PREDICTED: uncharacterized protein LOC109619369 [Crassostrea gigas]
MASTEAQVLSSLVYRIKRTIPLGCWLYVFDIDCSPEGSLCLSAINIKDYKAKLKSILFTSPYGRYMATNSSTDYYYTSVNSVFKVMLSDFSKEKKKIWPVEVRKPNPGCITNDGYTPQGITVRKSGDVLICLWNNEIGEKSLGKVISTNGILNIFTDKNHPLYVCPTYIAENGNGDICVSDVRAVVVTDAGGMLRFRYQGNSSSSNFDPYGICCNSFCNIIVADTKNDKIHVVDKDGQFLHHVIYHGIKMPRVVCVDENNDLHVGEWHTDTINVIER